MLKFSAESLYFNHSPQLPLNVQMPENWLSMHAFLITPIVQCLLVIEDFVTTILLTIKI